MANIKHSILDRIQQIYGTQAVTLVEGTYELTDRTGTLTFHFSDGDVRSQNFKYVGVETNAFAERLLETGALIILAYRAQFNPPTDVEDFFASVTE